MPLTLHVIADAPGLAALAPRWRKLQQVRPNPFSTWEWVQAWWSIFGQGHTLHLLLVQDGDALVGIGPFYMHRLRKGGVTLLTQLRLLGDGAAASDHLDLLAVAGREAEVAEAVAHHLRHLPGSALRLDGLSGESPLLAPLGRLFTWRDRPLYCPYIDLPQNWETFAKGLGKSLRYNLKRDRRRLEDMGTLAFSTAATPQEVTQAMESLFRLHGEVWRSRGRTGAFADPSMEHFHRQVALAFLEQGWLRLFSLSLDGEAVAILYCFSLGRTMYYYQTGFALTLREYGPGSLILGHAVQEALREGATRFDFLRGREGYKLRWSQQEYTDHQLHAPISPWGRLWVEGMALGYRIKERIRQRSESTG